MKAPKFWMVVSSLLVAGVVGLAYAKLPPPTDAQKAGAAAKKEKAAAAAKTEKEALGKAMDRAVDNYKRGKGMKPMAAGMPAEKMKK